MTEPTEPQTTRSATAGLATPLSRSGRRRLRRWLAVRLVTTVAVSVVSGSHLFVVMPSLAGPAQVLPAREPSPTALPATIPLFPLPDAVLFPNGARALAIFEPRYREMVADAIKGDGVIGMVLLQPGYEAEYEGRPPIHAIGCAGRISEVEQLPDGRYSLVLTGLTRFRVLAEEPGRVYRVGRVQPIAESGGGDPAVLHADRQRLEALLSAVGIEVSAPDTADEELIDVMAQYVEMAAARRQELLEMDGVLQRARALIALLLSR
jgi:Lon protease-like protein